MSKKSCLLIGILLSALLAGCQSNPTLINSTQHQSEKPKTSGEHSTTNANGSVKTEEHNTSHREPMNTLETNHSTSQPAPKH